MTNADLVKLEIQLSRVQANICDVVTRGCGILPDELFDLVEGADEGLRAARFEICGWLTSKDWQTNAGQNSAPSGPVSRIRSGVGEIVDGSNAAESGQN